MSSNLTTAFRSAGFWVLDTCRRPSPSSWGSPRLTVYKVKSNNDVARKAGSGRKAILDPNVITAAVEANLLKSLRDQAKEIEVPKSTIHDAFKNLGGKSLERLERPFLTPHVKEVHRQHCQALNNLKSINANRIIIFIIYLLG